MEIELLEEMLQKGYIVVNIAESFPWKDLAISLYGNRDRVRIISDSELLKLYWTYEFSDRFIVLDDNNRYGSVWNYVREGILSAEEALESLIVTG